MITPLELKRNILKRLYEFYHKESNRGAMDTKELFRSVGEHDEADFYEALQYLHDEDYVEGTPMPFDRQGSLRTAKITKKGIELVDDPSEFESTFPSDGKSMMVEEFVQTVRLEIERADLDRDEKDALLEDLTAFITKPSMRDAVASAIRRLSG